MVKVVMTSVSGELLTHVQAGTVVAMTAGTVVAMTAIPTTLRPRSMVCRGWWNAMWRTLTVHVADWHGMMMTMMVPMMLMGRI